MAGAMAPATAAAEPTTAPLGEVVRTVTERLRAAGSPSPRLDAEVLAAHALGTERAWVVAHPEAALPDAPAAALEAAVARRATGEPVAYIRGYKEWRSLRIAVDPRVLIPRPDTELLAEAAIEMLTRRVSERSLAASDHVVAWDVGTGSGALAVAMGLPLRDALRDGRLRLVASDRSRDALDVAATNLAAHGLTCSVELVEADLIGAAGAAEIDVVVANLPYIPTDEVDRLPVAASFEPTVALDGGVDGLDPIRALVSRLPTALASTGVALLEVGAGQAPAVVEIARGAGLAAETPLRDLAGVERVVALHRGRRS